MKRKIFTLFCALFALAVTAANPTERALFERTTRRVDAGGINLIYVNTSMLNSKLMELPALINKIAVVADAPAADAQMITEISEILLRVINPAAYEAFATSSVRQNSDLYINKGFVAIKNQPALLNSFVRNNSPLDWHKLPADTRIAFKFPVNGGLLFDRIYQEFAKAKSPQLRMVTGFVEQAKQKGIDLKAICSSLNGDVLLVVSGSNLNDLAIRVELPDSNGSLSALLQLFLPKRQGENFSRLPIPENNIFQAQLRYAPGKITAISHPRALNITNTLGAVPAFRKYAANLPGSGYGYAVINLDADTIAYIGGMLKFQQLSMLLKPVSIIDIGVKYPDGIASVGASNIETANLSTLLPASAAIGAAIMLPALNSARERARQASCMNNLKQIATGIFTYVQDHREKYPATLAELYREKYFVDNHVFHCPSDESSNDSYIYVGMAMNNSGNAGYASTNAYTIPIAFDKPGIHRNNYVNVAFADGHVQGIKLPNYTDPEQVIAYLNKMYNFPPQLLDALLKAVRSNQR